MKRFLSCLLVTVMSLSLGLHALATGAGYTDVAETAYYAEAVLYMRENDLMDGASADTFAPDRTMTRAMITEVLYRVAGSPDFGAHGFPDIPENAWYANAAAWSSANDIVNGYADGTFGGDNPVSREQIAVILWRYAGRPSVESGEDFADEARIGTYAAQAADWARANGMVEGKEGNLFDPKGPATRGQVAAILYRYLTGYASETMEEPERESANAGGGIQDPALQNEVKVVSEEPYVMSGDQTYFVADKVLNNGYAMPVLGIGTYALTAEQAENSVYHALKDGYRLVDTARAYYNEDGVGRGIRRAIDEGLVTREEIFVTTKVWDTDFGNARAAFDESLERLGLEYVDLVLLHHVPRANDEAAYHALEGAVREGKIRSLGLSNIYLDNDTFDRMYSAAEIKPVLVQNENHPFFQNTDFQEYISQYGLFIESWYPLGGRGFTQNYFNDPTLLEIAEAHNVTVAQVLLRWHLQAGYITIPGSSNPDHIAENYDIFKFELTDAEMETLKAMDTGHGNFNLRA